MSYNNDNKIIDCRLLAKTLRSEIKNDIKNIELGLGIILIGDNKSSQIYVKKIEDMCKELGIRFELTKYNGNTPEYIIKNKIEVLNKDENVGGILVPLPIPPHYDPDNIINCIDTKKDVDGVLETSKTLPCTLQACMYVLDKLNTTLIGKHVVVIGCSRSVGLPIALHMLKNMYTVTVCHKFTESIESITRMADILIACCGVPKIVKKDWVKDGVIILDVGINEVDGNVVGDVDTEEVLDKVRYITRVPNGLGQLTINMIARNLLHNFFKF